jgi:hypothetical protein
MRFSFFPDYFLLISVCVDSLFPETTFFQLHLVSHTSMNYCRRQSSTEFRKVRHFVLSFFIHEKFSDRKWNLMKQENLDLEKKIKELDLKIIEQNSKIQKLSESDREMNLIYEKRLSIYTEESKSLKEKVKTSTILSLSRELPLSHFSTPSTCRCQRAIRGWCHSSPQEICQ